MKIAALVFFAAFHAAAGCLDRPEDLLRHPLRLDLPQPESRPARPSLLSTLSLPTLWFGDEEFDLRDYTQRLRDLLHDQHIGTTLVKPTEERYTLILEGVGPEGNGVARCYLEMAELLEVGRVVVHIMGPATRDNADNPIDAGFGYFFRYLGIGTEDSDQLELALPMEAVFDFLFVGFANTVALHEFRHAAFARLERDGAGGVFGHHIFSTSLDDSGDEFSMQELYNLPLDAIYYRDAMERGESTPRRSIARIQENIGRVGYLALAARESAADALEALENSSALPVIRSREPMFAYIAADSRQQQLALRLSPETRGIMDDYLRGAVEEHIAEAALNRAVAQSLEEIISVSSFVDRLARNTLWTLTNLPNATETVKWQLESLASYLQDSYFSHPSNQSLDYGGD